MTLPDGRIETFDIQATPTCNNVVPILDVTLSFAPRAGTLSSLETVAPIGGRLSNGNLVIPGSAAPLDPQRYRLTTKEGFVYILNQAFGIETVSDPNGNTLTYSDTGIVHSSGKSVLFNRDASGRITAITDPNGNVLSYTYDANNDLVTATDQTAASTQYTYDSSHGLIDILDPLNRPLVKNIYDATGRLIAQIDGNATAPTSTIIWPPTKAPSPTAWAGSRP